MVMILELRLEMIKPVKLVLERTTSGSAGGYNAAGR